jgi:hypothetical protein
MYFFGKIFQSWPVLKKKYRTFIISVNLTGYDAALCRWLIVIFLKLARFDLQLIVFITINTKDYLNLNEPDSSQYKIS